MISGVPSQRSGGVARAEISSLSDWVSAALSAQVCTVWHAAGGDGHGGHGEAPVKCAVLSGLAQPLLGVFGQEIAQRDATAPGLGREPPGKVTGKDDGAVHAVVALPALVTQWRHAPLLSHVSAADL